MLRVRDTGPGIPEDRWELIFTDGWSTKKPPAHGKRGIGLPMVRRLAERQGGSAQVAEADGGGAEFTVVLPEALREPVLEPEAGLAAEPGHAGHAPDGGHAPDAGLTPEAGLTPGTDPQLVPEPHQPPESPAVTTTAMDAKEGSR